MADYAKADDTGSRPFFNELPDLRDGFAVSIS